MKKEYGNSRPHSFFWGWYLLLRMAVRRFFLKKDVHREVSDKVWCFQDKGLSSNVYLIDIKEPILIDLGASENSEGLLAKLASVGYKPEDIKKVIFTHFHYDHVGRPSDFPNAKFYASSQEILNLKNKGYLSVLRRKEYLAIKSLDIHPIENIKLDYLEVILTPGHTSGSICLWLPKHKILFSGDTLFKRGIVGITNTPTSVRDKLASSLKKLEKYKYDLLCPGH